MPDQTSRPYSVRIREEKDARGWSLARLHEEVIQRTGLGVRGTSTHGIRALTRGIIANPRREVLQAVADALDVRLEWLADGELPKRKESEAQRQIEAVLERADAAQDAANDLAIELDGLGMTGLDESVARELEQLTRSMAWGEEDPEMIRRCGQTAARLAALPITVLRPDATSDELRAFLHVQIGALRSLVNAEAPIRETRRFQVLTHFLEGMYSRMQEDEDGPAEE
jgi:transcriptional regulator with XRE-family HTH domain